jgi:hypothetical protein
MGYFIFGIFGLLQNKLLVEFTTANLEVIFVLPACQVFRIDELNVIDDLRFILEEIVNEAIGPFTLLSSIIVAPKMVPLLAVGTVTVRRMFVVHLLESQLSIDTAQFEWAARVVFVGAAAGETFQALLSFYGYTGSFERFLYVFSERQVREEVPRKDLASCVFDLQLRGHCNYVGNIC